MNRIKLSEKLKKLQGLAQGNSNVHEARLAGEMARKIKEKLRRGILEPDCRVRGYQVTLRQQRRIHIII